ncbi:MAG: hypothetical protein ACYS67_05685 [Planctomycetota bacterium]|jgi:hypothetical protein
MKAKRVILAVSGVFLAFFMHSTSEAVNIGDIDRVRNKPVLDNADRKIIDDFMNEAVQELVSTKDFASIAQIRTIITFRRTSKKSSAEAQYANQFSESALKYISSGLQEAEKLTPKDRRFKMTLNLLILIDGLEDVRLAKLAMGLFKDESKVIRYWAVHSVTSPGFTKKLNATISANSQLAGNIVDQLQGLLGRSGPETVALIAGFAAEVSIAQGENLLGRIADRRIQKYADWKVDYEPLDGIVLRLLYQKIFSGAVNKPAAARRFAQLYSYVIQRYVKGRDILNASQKHQLASILVETEKSCVSRLLGKPQTVIKRSVERNDYTRLLLEHSRILGDETRSGELPVKLNFDYGMNPNSTPRTAPLALPEPPEKSTTNN